MDRGLKLTPEIHVVRDTPVARYLRRRFRDPHIFTYFHRIHRTWNIATWLGRGQGIAIEEGLWTGKSGDCPREIIDEFAFHRSQQWLNLLREARVHIGQTEHRADEAAADWQEGRIALREYMRKRCSKGVQADNPEWVTMA